MESANEDDVDEDKRMREAVTPKVLPLREARRDLKHTQLRSDQTDSGKSRHASHVYSLLLPSSGSWSA